MRTLSSCPTHFVFKIGCWKRLTFWSLGHVCKTWIQIIPLWSRNNSFRDLVWLLLLAVRQEINVVVAWEERWGDQDCSGQLRLNEVCEGSVWVHGFARPEYSFCPDTNKLGELAQLTKLSKVWCPNHNASFLIYKGRRVSSQAQIVMSAFTVHLCFVSRHLRNWILEAR